MSHIYYLVSNMKKKIFVVLSISLILFTISAVSADDNLMNETNINPETPVVNVEKYNASLETHDLTKIYRNDSQFEAKVIETRGSVIPLTKPAKMIFEAVREARPQATAHCGRAGEGKRTAEEVGISSLRMGNVVGIHEVHICNANQTLTLRHEAHDRGMFADGAVEAAAFLEGKSAGLYNMTGILEA